MSNYTQGEWVVKHSESKAAFNVVGTILGRKYKIARCPYLILENWPDGSEKEKQEAEANAKLIAAAPDLLEALQLMKYHAEMFINYNHPDHKKAVAAINKATK